MSQAAGGAAGAGPSSVLAAEQQPPKISNVAQRRWELENDVAVASGSDQDALYRFDAEEQKAIQASKPWKNDPHFFKRCVM